MDFKNYFPYDRFRPHQLEIINSVFDSIKNKKNLIIEAPSGIGKTISVLTGLIPYLNKDTLLIYLTRTYREIERVISELRFFKGFQIKAIGLKGKKEMCLNKEIENLKNFSYGLFNFYCNRFKENLLCEFYNNYLSKNDFIIKNIKKKFSSTISSSTILDLGININCCPYEIQRDFLKFSNVIISTYNYILSPEFFTGLDFFNVSYYKNKILVIDEAHNIIDHSIKNFSSIIKLDELYILKEIIKNKNLKNLLINFLNYFEKFRINETNILKINIKDLINIFENELNINYFNKLINFEINNLIKYNINYLIIIYNLYDFLNKLFLFSTENLLILYKKFNSLFLELIILNPSYYLRKIFEQFTSVIFISATMKPFELFIKLCGLDMNNLKILEIPFSLNYNVLPIFIKNITTSFHERKPENYKMIIEILKEAVENSKGNVGIFAASYNIINDLLNIGFKDIISKPLFIEDPKMSSYEIEKAIQEFKNLSKDGAVLLAIQGGRFSEGEDFPGEQMSTIIILGLAYDFPSLIVKEKIYQISKMFPKKGWTFAYLFPAIKKAIQTSGRAFRSESDKGVVIFLDSRFLNKEVLNYLPIWLKEKRIVISWSYGKLKKHLKRFYY